VEMILKQHIRVEDQAALTVKESHGLEDDFSEFGAAEQRNPVDDRGCGKESLESVEDFVATAAHLEISRWSDVGEAEPPNMHSQAEPGNERKNSGEPVNPVEGLPGFKSQWSFGGYFCSSLTSSKSASTTSSSGALGGGSWPPIGPAPGSAPGCC